MWNVIFDVWTTGIDFDLPGNGGPACARYLSPQRRILEFLLGTTLALVALFLGWACRGESLSWAMSVVGWVCLGVGVVSVPK